jgi:hypothetical protein
MAFRRSRQPLAFSPFVGFRCLLVGIVGYTAYQRFQYETSRIHIEDTLIMSVDRSLTARTPTTDTLAVYSETDDPSQQKLINPKAQQLPRVLALYFPQFHREPLNDRLWGDGFTDWNSLRAAPVYNRLGQRIPRPASDANGGLGYYDLLNTTVRQRHGQLAQAHGIDGFIYHHYWFYKNISHPGPTMAAPLLAMLKDGHPNLSFCLQWVNTGWRQTWSHPSRMATAPDAWLQEQRFPQDEGEDDEIDHHYRWLRQFFQQDNYIRVDGQPVLIIYFYDPLSVYTLQKLRTLAVADGYPGLYLILSRYRSHDILFPEGRALGGVPWKPKQFDGLFNQTLAYPYALAQNEGKSLRVPDWCQTSDAALAHPPTTTTSHAPQIAGILTSFDNTPRRPFNESRIWSTDAPDVTVKRFADSARAAIYYETCCRPAGKLDSKFVVINAWNEWAEGMALEPSDVFGTRFLQAIVTAKETVRSSQCRWSSLQ